MTTIDECDDPGAKFGGRPEDGAPVDIGRNLREIRKQRGLSLEMLAKLSNVSRAMLGQIETGKSVPTVTLLLKISKALGVSASSIIDTPRSPRAVVLKDGSARLLSFSEGRFSLRSFSAAGFDRHAEVSELTLQPGHSEFVEPFSAGTRATLVMTSGRLEFTLGDEFSQTLTVGDAVLFEADAPQSFVNSSPDIAKGFLVVVPARTLAGDFQKIE